MLEGCEAGPPEDELMRAVAESDALDAPLLSIVKMENKTLQEYSVLIMNNAKENT